MRELFIYDAMCAAGLAINGGTAASTPEELLAEMDRYGVDKPDTRFEMELADFTEIFKKSQFKVFSAISISFLICLEALKSFKLKRYRFFAITLSSSSTKEYFFRQL